MSPILSVISIVIIHKIVISKVIIRIVIVYFTMGTVAMKITLLLSSAGVWSYS